MKISEASITIKADGFNRLVEYPEMPVVDLIARLFEIHGAEIEVVLPDAKRAEFERLALKEWHRTATDLPKDAYVKLWVDKETEKYFAIQRIHKAFNEYVMAEKGQSPAPEFFPGVKEQLDDALKIRKDENA